MPPHRAPYLRNLEREGYIRVDVIQSQTTRMCAGLLVHLLRPLFPQHHKDKWPRTLANPDATAESHKKNLIRYKGQRGLRSAQNPVLFLSRTLFVTTE